MFLKIVCRFALLAMIMCAAPAFAQFWGMIPSPESAGNEMVLSKESVVQEETASDEKVVKIYYQQVLMNGGKTQFYIWIHYPNVTVRNTSQEMRVGFDMGRGGLYIENKPSYLNRMFFVTNYDDGNLPGDVIVWFGGARADDINIRLPEGYTAIIVIGSISEGKDPAQ